MLHDNPIDRRCGIWGTITHMRREDNYTRSSSEDVPPAPYVPVPEHGDLQRLVDEVFEAAEGPVGTRAVTKLDLLMRADIDDLSDDLREVIDLMPGGRLSRHRLCDQMNSIITAHGWAYAYGTVE